MQDKASRRAHRLSLVASARQPSEEVQPQHLHLEVLAAQHSALEVLARQLLVLQAPQRLVLPAQAVPAFLAAHLPLEQPARQPSALQVAQRTLLSAIHYKLCWMVHVVAMPLGMQKP